MYGLGKPRTKLGKWLDRMNIKQQWLADKTKLNKDTISRLCNDERYNPNRSTRYRVISALRIIDPRIHEEDFWA